MNESRPRRPDRHDGRGRKQELAKWYEDGEETPDDDEQVEREGIGARIWRVLTTPVVRPPSTNRDGKPISGNLAFRITVVLRGLVWLALIAEVGRLNRVHQRIIANESVAVVGMMSPALIFQLMFALAIAFAMDAIFRLPSAGRS